MTKTTAYEMTMVEILREQLASAAKRTEYIRQLMENSVGKPDIFEAYKKCYVANRKLLQALFDEYSMYTEVS